MAGGRFRELLRKYGKVSLGVHLSISAASTTGIYIAVKNNVDVESMLEKFGITSLAKEKETQTTDLQMEGMDKAPKERNRTAELVASGGGALAVALLINKALIPVRIPITIAVTPPIAKFLARRKLLKSGL